ncbi:skin secretory protein xP2-like [Rhopalosiphum maidis]|uniref:skin secretory protein xP2-like n=1 Tax=Rhopalosiphum maidis TaxID=43146 RepID=UPI000F00A4DD|nr:skin secretory protein xP2-like [Rhopalosiphum maidis]
MTCPMDKLYQLEFMVKTMTRCSRPEDEGCGTAISIRFLGSPDQTVCEIPSPADCPASGVTNVNAGNEYTFPMTGSGKCDPRSLRVSVRLHRMLGADTLPGRVELASGDLEVPVTAKPDGRRRRRPDSSSGGACAADCDDNADDGCEMTVPMTSCHDGRTVSVLVVKARVWCVGPMMAAPIACPVPCPAPCKSACPVSCPTPCKATCPIPCKATCPVPCKATCPVPCPAPCGARPAPCPTPCPVPCGSRPASKPPCPVPCGSRPASQSVCPVRCSPPPDPCCRKKPASACDPCRKKTIAIPCCPTGCPQPRPCRRPCCSTAIHAQCPQQQYETVSCEIDGNKMDLRVRKKNFETCSVQRRIANEAEAFACRVMGVVKDMHGLVMDSTNNGGGGN